MKKGKLSQKNQRRKRKNKGKKGEESMKKIINFFKEEDGVTSVEYAIMVAVIALVVIAGATLLGTNTNTTFTNAAGRIPNGS